jgi:hypothetical protein
MSMASGRFSKLWGISAEELQFIYDNSNSQTEVLQKCGLDPTSGTHRTLKLVAEKYNIDKTIQLNNLKLFFSRHHERIAQPRDVSNDFCLKSTVGRGVLKRYIIRNNIIAYECDVCKNNGVWIDKKLVLQLEHKNGINDDNRIENLCFLCPNCHTQTATYSGKNKIGAKYRI